MTSFNLDLRSFGYLVVINNLWQVARLESRTTDIIAISDWVLALDEPTVWEDERFDRIYLKLINNDDIIQSLDFSSKSVPALPESSPASCETQITVSITVLTNYADNIIDDLHQLNLQPNFFKRFRSFHLCHSPPIP